MFEEHKWLSCTISPDFETFLFNLRPRGEGQNAEKMCQTVKMVGVLEVSRQSESRYHIGGLLIE